jgi:uncharacterized membrane protein YhaH (DUF805 family)
MGPVTAVYSFFSRTFDVNGRSRRSEYAWALIFNVLVAVFIGWLLVSAGLDDAALETGHASTGSEVLIWTVILIALALCVPWTTLQIRRFHDMGHTGWLVALFFGLQFVPIIGLIAMLIQFFWLLLGSGTAGNNPYGADPRTSGVSVF